MSTQSQSQNSGIPACIPFWLTIGVEMRRGAAGIGEDVQFLITSHSKITMTEAKACNSKAHLLQVYNTLYTGLVMISRLL
ncbi:hypothetical protein RRG08_038509 [Elysia crispata]|uniref:Uncharacterized protein n=1 Tax=Elysia crispata TaxID=231223 RepID=A0AAE1AH81_9GAST|nr:hypothetical protein RRG08_038509 [Elysia crispata]